MGRKGEAILSPGLTREKAELELRNTSLPPCNTNIYNTSLDAYCENGRLEGFLFTLWDGFLPNPFMKLIKSQKGEVLHHVFA